MQDKGNFNGGPRHLAGPSVQARGALTTSLRITLLCALGALSSGCATKPAMNTEGEDSKAPIPALVALVRADATQRPRLIRALVTQKVWMIPDPHANRLAVLAFDQNERSFVPVFSDQKTFDVESYGTGFEHKAVAVDGSVFASLVDDDAIVVLNPGDRPAIEFRGYELKSSAAR